MVMKEVNSPTRKPLAELPPQKSASDTSNWEHRHVSAPTIDKKTKRPTKRDVSFNRIKHDKPDGSMTLVELQALEQQNRTKSNA